MNAVFHVMAALGLVLATWMYIKARSEVQWMHEWLRDAGGLPSKLRVAQPERFFRRLGLVLGVPVEIATAKTGQAQIDSSLRSMRGGGIMALMTSFGIRSLAWQSAESGVSEKLSIRTIRQVTSPAEWSERLCRELGFKAGGTVTFYEGEER